MKRILLTFALSLIITGVFAQEHLSFKGIPLEGSMTSFCQKLKAKGLKSLGSQNNIQIFTGDFTGREATVGVVSTSDGKDVFGVVVLLPASKEWNNLVNTYDYYKDLYVRKYGEPSVSRESNPSNSDSNTSLMAEVYQGTVTYVSAWEVAGGSIDLSIEKTNGVYEGQVVIRYRDSQNAEAKLKQDLDDI